MINSFGRKWNKEREREKERVSESHRGGIGECEKECVRLGNGRES